jgi:hypothetical protein
MWLLGISGTTNYSPWAHTITEAKFLNISGEPDRAKPQNITAAVEPKLDRPTRKIAVGRAAASAKPVAASITLATPLKEQNFALCASKCQSTTLLSATCKAKTGAFARKVSQYSDS